MPARRVAHAFSMHRVPRLLYFSFIRAFFIGKFVDIPHTGARSCVCVCFVTPSIPLTAWAKGVRELHVARTTHFLYSIPRVIAHTTAKVAR